MPKLDHYRVLRGLAAFVLALAITGLANPAGAARPTADPRSEHQRIVDFWTPDRVAHAIPREVAYDPATGRFELARAGGIATKGRPGGGGGGGGTTSGLGTTTGTWWHDIDANLDRTVARATGKVLFEMGNYLYTCSATVVTEGASDRSLVLTAGHCAYDWVTGFAENWIFVPDYESDPAASLGTDQNGDGYLDHADLTSLCGAGLGCWTASALVVHDGFVAAGDFNVNAILNDFAFAVVEQGGLTNQQGLAEDLAGHQDINFTSMSKGTTTAAFGYPAASPFHGDQLRYCNGGVSFDRSTLNLTYKLGCDMNGGSSGGGWYRDFDPASGAGTLVSLNSYTYTNRTGSMYGPKFNSDTATVYDASASLMLTLTPGTNLGAAGASVRWIVY